MKKGSQEIEIKLAVPDARTGRRMLRAAGFEVSRGRVFEANTLFDTQDLSLRNSSRLLRIRTAGRISSVTYKGVPEVGRHKSREELEVTVSDPRTMAAMVERIGFHPVFRYEKYRTEYRRPRSAGVVVVDETPIGVYLELEGGADWIDRTAKRLGFSEADYITASYGRLYLEWAKQNKREPGDMVFA
jgi:adenylate cyclase, class 2